MANSHGESERGHRYGLPVEIGGIWWTIYDGIAAAGIALVKLTGLFHKRLGAAVKGREGGVSGWQMAIQDSRHSVLIHAASRGEFEAVRPLLERLMAGGKYRAAVSFSSPSVEKAVRNHTGLSACGYLPFDNLGEQLRFLSRLEPSVILVAKHDIWPNMIRAAWTLGIPYIIVNANFHARTKRRLPFVGSFNRRFLSLVTEIWTVSENDAERIKPLVAPSVRLKVVGDTRYDRTLERAALAREKFATLKTALGVGPVIVAGSTWQPEEKIVLPAFKALKNLKSTAKLILAPHEPGAISLQRCRKLAGEQGLSLIPFSEWNGNPITEDILYIDRMGILADIYSAGWAAVVGGGFGVGVHSVLEPAAYGIPVAFGPNYHVSHEAGLLIASGGGIVLTDWEDLFNRWSSWLKDPTDYSRTAQSAAEVVKAHAGATERVMELLEPYLQSDG